MLNVLVTSTNTVTALNVFRALENRRDVRLFSTDMRAESAGLVYASKHFKVDHAESDEYVEQMLSICKRENIKYLFPSSDAECRKISENIKKFISIGTLAMTSSPEVVGICCDKLKTYDHFKKIGIKSPRTWEYSESKEENFPLVMRTKLAGIGKKSVNFLHNEAELAFFANSVKSPKVMSELVEGRELTIDVLSDKKGRVLKVVPRERTYILNGNTKIGTIVADEKIIEETTKIVESLGIVGISCVQCIQNDEGNFYFEINPRVGSGLDLTVRSGFNFPSLLIDMFEGKDIIDKLNLSLRAGLKMVRFEDCHIISEK
jgi:carbamoyl-phosphate synthase large subunit